MAFTPQPLSQSQKSIAYFLSAAKHQSLVEAVNNSTPGRRIGYTTTMLNLILEGGLVVEGEYNVMILHGQDEERIVKEIGGMIELLVRCSDYFSKNYPLILGTESPSISLSTDTWGGKVRIELYPLSSQNLWLAKRFDAFFIDNSAFETQG